MFGVGASWGLEDEGSAFRGANSSHKRADIDTMASHTSVEHAGSRCCKICHTFHAQLPRISLRPLASGNFAELAEAVRRVWITKSGMGEKVTEGQYQVVADQMIPGTGAVVLRGVSLGGRPWLFVAACPMWYFGSAASLTCMLRPDVHYHLTRIARSLGEDTPEPVSPDTFLQGRCSRGSV